MISVIVPAHNEEAVIGHCLKALLVAASHPCLYGEVVQIVVVMDCCTDDTRLVVGDYPVQGIVGRYRNVGKARAAGSKYALEQGTRWLAFTDADTVVPASWLVKQLGCGTDVVCGTVTDEDWSLNNGDNSRPTVEKFAFLQNFYAQR